MPRQARLDAPDALHHVMVRGLERRGLFRDDPDRAEFVARLAALAEGGAWTVYAWAVLPNHAHLLVRTGTRPLARSRKPGAGHPHLSPGQVSLDSAPPGGGILSSSRRGRAPR